MWIVYALVDSRDGKVRYVGMTDNVYKRFQAHIRCSGGNIEKNAWVLSMREANVMVQMIELERFEDRGRARVREIYWINHYIDLGHPLVNIQRSMPRLVSKVLVRSSEVKSPKSAIAAVESGIASVAAPVAFIPGVTDKVLSEIQAGVLVAQYRAGEHDVKKLLSSQGLGIGTYYHHACFVLDSLGLRQKRA